MEEDKHFGWYRALNFGEVVGEGPTPFPDELKGKYTEIHWFESEPKQESPEPAA